jgi:tRNA-2-methylthio-N6-dimethylallyladenosine synthase
MDQTTTQPGTSAPVQVSREEMMRQWGMAADNRRLLANRMGRTPQAWVRTFGCQGNVADSEKLMGMLLDMGCEQADSEEDADIILYNTCAIRENAELRLMSMVGQLKRLKNLHPQCLVGLCGCMMQQEQAVQQICRSYPFVELVFGTHVMYRLPELINRLLHGERRVVDCYEGPHRENRIAEDLPVSRAPGVMASLPIMYGCDNFCSYCIVPYVRGREVSREPEQIIAEARSIVAQGYREILLLGQNVNSYGKGLSRPVNFAQLLSQIDAIEGDFRIRFMTSHPKDCTKELIDCIAQSKKICHSIHLPVQSGSNRVLEQMNRRYTREHYLELIRYAREKMPDVTFTTDIIVGFPGETYEDFLQTLSLCQEVRYQSMYTFVFSPRPGTRAAQMEDPVSYGEKTKWLGELIAAQHTISEEDNSAMVGSVQRVLVTHPWQKQEGWMCGSCENGMNIHFPAQDIQPGSFVRVEVTCGLRSEYEGILVK